MTDLPLRCQCRRLTAVVRDVSPRAANRVVCCCKFCQSYARHLGRGDAVLDEWGGTEVVQVRPSRIEFLEGRDQLGCLHLTETGARRWYAQCCKTPIANTMARGHLPFAGLVTYVVDRDALTQPLEEVVGPIIARVNGDFGDQASAMRATRWDLARMLMHFVPLFGKWYLLGDQRRSPFFGTDGRPVVTPTRVKHAA